MDENTSPTSPGALWNVMDVARFLKVSRSWVYQHAEDGTLPSIKIGGLRRFIPEQIYAYAAGEPSPARTDAIRRLR